MHKTQSLRSLLQRLLLVPIIGLTAMLMLLTIYQATIGYANIKEEQRRQVSALSLITEQYMQEKADLVHAAGHMLIKQGTDEQRITQMDTLLNVYDEFSALYFVNPNGKVILTDSKSSLQRGLDMSGESFFKNAERDKETYISDTFMSLTGNKVTVTVAAPIIDRFGAFVGIMVGELQLSYLQDVIERVKQHENTQVFITDHTGNLIAYPDEVWVQEQRNLNHALPLQNCTPTVFQTRIYQDPDTSIWMLSGSNCTHEYWVVIAEQPLFSAMAELILTGFFTLLSLLLSFSILSIMRTQSYRELEYPIKVLAEHADEFAQGNYSASTQGPASNLTELNSLEQNFARMAFAVKQRTQELEFTNAELQNQIQERKQAEETVKRLNSELEERVRERTAEMEAAIHELESSSYTISHDLRAPLRAIHGYTSIMLDEFEKNLPPEAIAYIHRVRDNAHMMGSMVDNLLAFLRLNRVVIQRRRVNIDQMASNVFHELMEREPVQRLVDFTCDPAPICSADPELLERALVALFSNALKFSRSQDETKIHFGSIIDGNSLVYFVQDNGIGFDMRYSGKLFGIFQHLHSPGEVEGSGVGLAMVQRIIQKHSGRIWAVGEVNHGATFYFTLN